MTTYNPNTTMQPDSEESAIYPASEDKRFGVRTDRGTHPVEMDQGDEQYEGKLYGTPDDLTTEYGTEQNDYYIDQPPLA